MLKKYLLYLLPALIFTGACNKEADEIEISEVVNWYAIGDKPGELGHLLHDIYQETGLSIFVNDTLGYTDGGIDAYGNPVRYYETVSDKYYIYGSYSKIRFRLSSDTAAMLKAVRTIEKWVIPNMSPSPRYRSKSLLLTDSLFWEFYGGDTVQPGGKTAWVADISVETTPVGKLAEIKKMDEKELKFWAGMILAAKVYPWLEDLYADSLTQFYRITNRDVPYSTFYQNGYSFYWADAETGEYLADDPMDLRTTYDFWKQGFLEWADIQREDPPVWKEYYGRYMKKIYRKVPSKACDVMNYIAAVYAYSDEEFMELFAHVKDRQKCIDKRLYMEKLVELFEQAQGITRHRFE